MTEGEKVRVEKILPFSWGRGNGRGRERGGDNKGGFQGAGGGKRRSRTAGGVKLAGGAIALYGGGREQKGPREEGCAWENRGSLKETTGRSEKGKNHPVGEKKNVNRGEVVTQPSLNHGRKSAVLLPKKVPGLPETLQKEGPIPKEMSRYRRSSPSKKK